MRHKIYKIVFPSVIVVALLTAITTTHPHKGQVNKDGGHYDEKSGTYHFHALSTVTTSGSFVRFEPGQQQTEKSQDQTPMVTLVENMMPALFINYLSADIGWWNEQILVTLHYDDMHDGHKRKQFHFSLVPSSAWDLAERLNAAADYMESSEYKGRDED